TSSGGSPNLLSSLDVLTCTSTSSERPSDCRRLSSASATRRLSSAWNPDANSATSLALLVCKWPMIDQRRSGKSDIACHLPCASCTLFSPSVRQPAAYALRSRTSGTVLLTGSTRTLAGSRPTFLHAAAMRACTPARCWRNSPTVLAVVYVLIASV